MIDDCRGCPNQGKQAYKRDGVENQHHEKDTKGESVRASYSPIAAEAGTNLIRDAGIGDFHLTIFRIEPCTSTMVRTTTNNVTARRSRLSGSLYGKFRIGWRRVATVAATGLAIAVGYHVVFGQNGLTAYQQKNHDAKMLDGQLKSLQRENEQLKAHVERLQNDPSAIEHQAREELHYTRPGEVIYTLPAAPSSPNTNNAGHK